MRYALVDPQNQIIRMAIDVDPNVQTKPGWRWLPYVTSVAPNTEPTEIVAGPTYSVGASAVTEVWTKRSLTAQEIDDRKEARLSGFDALALKILFNHENRIRTIQNVSAATTAQFRAFLKANVDV